MGTETRKSVPETSERCVDVKLNNPLMGTETIRLLMDNRIYQQPHR